MCRAVRELVIMYATMPVRFGRAGELRDRWMSTDERREDVGVLRFTRLINC